MVGVEGTGEKAKFTFEGEPKPVEDVPASVSAAEAVNHP